MSSFKGGNFTGLFGRILQVSQRIFKVRKFEVNVSPNCIVGGMCKGFRIQNLIDDQKRIFKSSLLYKAQTLVE